LSPTSPPVDAVVNLEIMISALFGPTKARIKGRMRVQRIKHEVSKYGQTGFSVVGEWIELYGASANHPELGG
jgi:hypothetical protein